jgi:tetratricopeptide (TPR) repeat protein
VPAVSSPEIPPTELARAAIHREFIQLLVLLAIAIAGFFVTRAIAASNRDMSVRDALEWYQRGIAAVDGGRVDDAIDAFRRAAARDRSQSRYVLALARALALHHDDDTARNVLLTLREAAPESAEINLELARLAARRVDVPEALRFYHNALYAPWPADRAAERRDVRLELVRFLLSHQQSGRALSELLATASDLPDTLQMHLEVGQLFASAGDYTHSLDQFQQALRLSPNNTNGLVGAGDAAFRTGEYVMARNYFRRASSQDEEVTRRRDVVELILSRDPLAARLGSFERRRRLTSDVSYVQERLAGCEPHGSPAPSAGDPATLRQELDSLSEQLAAPGPLEQDTIEIGVELISRVSAYAAAACGPQTPTDQAMILIGRQHIDAR